MKPRRQTSTKPARSRAHDGGTATSKRIQQLEAEVEELRHNNELQGQRMTSLRAELDHCVAKMTELLGGRFR